MDIVVSPAYIKPGEVPCALELMDEIINECKGNLTDLRR
jgi:hypothetical protein